MKTKVVVVLLLVMALGLGLTACSSSTPAPAGMDLVGQTLLEAGTTLDANGCGYENMSITGGCGLFGCIMPTHWRITSQNWTENSTACGWHVDVEVERV